MKFASYRNQHRGSALVTTMVIGLLAGIVVTALLFVASQQIYLNARSQTWGSEIPIAEAGIEEAMTHLNSNPSTLAANGWTSSGSNVVKTRAIGDDSGYFYAAISTSTPPSIVSIGYGRIPLHTNFTMRTVYVTTRRNNSGYGVVAKGKILMSGGASVDSFDSSDSIFSSNGLYTVSRRHDQALVASLSSLRPAVDSGTGKIYGNAATGVGGTVAGNVGDGTWLASNSGIQSGHSSDDFNMAIDDVTVPFAGGLPLPSPVANIWTLTTGDYKETSSINVGGGKGIIIAGPGKVRVYFTSSFATSGSGYLKILAGASVEIYLGASGTISGTGVVNDNQRATDCAIYGLPTCNTMTYSGSSAYIGTVYTPQADFTFSGGTGASGSFVANTITITGSGGVHYDEALGKPGALYSILSWREL